MSDKDKPKGPQPATPLPKDVMLIPGSAGLTATKHNKQTFTENREFGTQWEAKDKTARAKLEVKIAGSLADFKSVVHTASAMARGKEVILLTGHGAIGDQSGLNQSAFDTVPEDDFMATHKNVITAEVVNLEDIATKQADGTWVTKRIVVNGVVQTTNQANIDAQSPRRDMLDDIGKDLKGGGVAALRLLTCNVGNDTKFIDRLAKILGVKVIAYKKFTITVEHSFPGPPSQTLVQLYVGDEPDLTTTPPTNPPPVVSVATDPQFTEIPHNDEATGNP